MPSSGRGTTTVGGPAAVVGPLLVGEFRPNIVAKVAGFPLLRWMSDCDYDAMVEKRKWVRVAVVPWRVGLEATKGSQRRGYLAPTRPALSKLLVEMTTR